MRFIITLTLILLSSFANAQSVDSIYGFINQFFDNKKQLDTTYYITNKPDFSAFTKYLFTTDSIEIYWHYNNVPSPISKKDSVFIFNQVGRFSNFRFKAKRLHNVSVISEKRLTKLFKKNDSEIGYYKLSKEGIKDGFHRISVPIFFNGGKNAIFYDGLHCGGLCGDYRVWIFEFADGKWEKKYLIYRGQS